MAHKPMLHALLSFFAALATSSRTLRCLAGDQALRMAQEGEKDGVRIHDEVEVAVATGFVAMFADIASAPLACFLFDTVLGMKQEEL